jgi:hypothetical protein
MKNIVSILALVAATASGANATVINSTATDPTDSPLWNGDLSVNAIPDHCEFVENSVTDGSMDYDIDRGVWSTTSDATVTIKHRGASELTVTNTGELIRTDEVAANMAVTVDYTGSSISGDGVISLADTAEISVGSLTDSSAKKETTINIGGTATMVNTDVETNGIENGGKYQIVHTVLCLN